MDRSGCKDEEGESDPLIGVEEEDGYAGNNSNDNNDDYSWSHFFAHAVEADFLSICLSEQIITLLERRLMVLLPKEASNGSMSRLRLIEAVLFSGIVFVTIIHAAITSV